jgi:hypothetical protein
MHFSEKDFLRNSFKRSQQNQMKSKLCVQKSETLSFVP